MAEPRPFIEYVAMTCQNLRESQNKSLARVADLAGVREATIAAFERNGTWPRDIERIVNAYAKATGQRPSYIWSDAVSLLAHYGG